MTRMLSALTGDAEIAALFSDDAELEGMLAFEAALAGAQADADVITADAAQEIIRACTTFVPDWPELRRAMARDGVIGPGFVAALKAHVDERCRSSVHFAATSQDVVDTSLILRLKKLVALLKKRIGQLIADLKNLAVTQGNITVMAQTRMQQALPFQAITRIESWLHPLMRDLERLSEIGPRLLRVQFGGPAGDRRGLAGKGDVIAAKMAQRLHLHDGPCWHNGRDSLLEFAGFLALVSGTTGKIGQDLALMAQNEIAAVKLPGGGASSAMAHKQNPVAAEVLVALARFNAGMLGTMHQAMVHENERSGAAWTLEWLVLPQMAEATGAALSHATTLISGLTIIGQSA